MFVCSAYVVHRAGSANAPKSFPKDVQLWIESRVARHKFLRGGVVVIDAIPKRLPIFSTISIACVECMFAVLRGKFCVGNYASEQSRSSGQVRLPRRSYDDLGLCGLYLDCSFSRHWGPSLRFGLYPHILVLCMYLRYEYQSRCYRNLD